MNVIVLNGDYNYVDKIETTIKSILWHNEDIEIHLINPDIPHEWFVNLNQYAKQIGSIIIDEKIDFGQLSELNAAGASINKIRYGKFLIPDLISANKVLYLDCDLVVNGELDDLFNFSFDTPIAAVRDFKEPDQFNSGVMLINNQFWRENQVGHKLIEMGKDPNLIDSDQSVINNFFKDNFTELPPTYNYQIGYERKAYWNDIDSTFAFLDQVKNPKIIHYTADDKPFNMVSTSDMRPKWWHYHNLEWSKIVAEHVAFDDNKVGEAKFDAEAFIFTQFAETQNLEALVKKLPNVRFTIAAYTPMAFLLTQMVKYDNVRLYPSIVARTLVDLMDTCDIYLDINFGADEDKVVRRVMDRNIPIYAFETTKSENSNYSNYRLFKDNEVDEMVSDIKDYLNKPTSLNSKPRFNIEVKSIDETLNFILRDRKSVIRFGDGELSLIRGKGITYQEADESLGKRLRSILFNGNYKNTLVCLPDVFDHIERFGQYARDFYETNFIPNNYDLLREIEQTNNWYGSSLISRPYMDLLDKSKSANYFERLKQIWHRRDILIVEGDLSRSGVGNDLFSKANSIKRILCPSRNAYEKIIQIEEAIRENSEDRLILLMLGPTAKVIVDDLKDLNNQMIDLGHIDSEYEWFTMGAKYKVRIRDKHTAEFNSDDNIESVFDEAYKEEIIAEIK
ncbi:SP_1767 family glycosyltransferase [uncultured Lactobacillus sp.]|uniref:SP_1767 family glycosyltransferase n=1 Tax=uncultured Lactobacillus sp. TaxID=153152 RepID=UPI002613E2CC|nr:SP_1767 family glycosyltransferase [uncultured Lactobacillus sp.]